MSRYVGYVTLGLLCILVIVSFFAGYQTFGGISGLLYVLPLFVIPAGLGKLACKPETVVGVLLSGFLAFQIGLRRESVILMYVFWPVFIFIIMWFTHLDKITFIRLIRIARRLFHVVGIFTAGVLASSYLFIGSDVNTLWNDTAGTGRYDSLGYGVTVNASKYFPSCTKLLALEGLQLVDIATYVNESIINISEGREIDGVYLEPWTKSGVLSDYIVVNETIELMNTIQDTKKDGIKPVINSDIVMRKLSGNINKLVPISIGEFLGVLYLGYIVIGLNIEKCWGYLRRTIMRKDFIASD